MKPPGLYEPTANELDSRLRCLCIRILVYLVYASLRGPVDPRWRRRLGVLWSAGRRGVVSRFGHALRSAMRVRAAALRYARRRWMRTTGMVTRIDGTSM